MALCWPDLNALYTTWPFLANVVVEVPAMLNFALRPDDQLSSPAPQAHDIIAQYACLLMVYIQVSIIFIFRPLDATTGYVAMALAVYHVAPTIRALKTLMHHETGLGSGLRLGGPWLHLTVHAICFFGLMKLGLRILLSRQLKHPGSGSSRKGNMTK